MLSEGERKFGLARQCNAIVLFCFVNTNVMGMVCFHHLVLLVLKKELKEEYSDCRFRFMLEHQVI